MEVQCRVRALDEDRVCEKPLCTTKPCARHVAQYSSTHAGGSIKLGLGRAQRPRRARGRAQWKAAGLIACAARIIGRCAGDCFTRPALCAELGKGPIYSWISWLVTERTIATSIEQDMCSPFDFEEGSPSYRCWSQHRLIKRRRYVVPVCANRVYAMIIVSK